MEYECMKMMGYEFLPSEKYSPIILSYLEKFLSISPTQTENA